MRRGELVEEFKKKLGCVLWKTKANEYKEYVKNLRAGQFFSVAFKDGLQAGIRVSAALETIIGGGWIVEAVEQSASFFQTSYNSRFLDGSYAYTISHIWNQLPSAVKNAPNASSFRRLLTKLNFIGCQCSNCL